MLCCALSVALVWSIRVNLRYMDTVDAVHAAVEECLDVLDTFYQRAAKRAKLEVMSDEPVVRELVADLKGAREAILLVASLIIEPMQFDEESSRQEWQQKEE